MSKIHIKFGKTLEEWNEKYGSIDELWDVSIEDIENGAIEPNEDYWYWFIGGRLYETYEEV